MIRTYVLLLLVLIGGSVHASQHVITSLPYQASRSYDTLTIAGTKLIGATDGITITGHDIVINLGSDTLVFGAGGGDNYSGITVSAPAYNVKIIGGTILHGGSGDHNRCLSLLLTHDLLISNTDMIVNGTNGHCINAFSVGPPGNYNIEVSGGNYWNNCHGYTSRCQYDGAAIRLWASSFGGFGTYHFKVHDIILHNTPGQGIVLAGRDQSGNEALVIAYNNILTGDARNSFYDYCAPNCETCLSSANPYLIAMINCAPGSKCYNNELYSGNNYGGSRGILIENCLGSFSQPIEIYDNYMDLHEGPNHEYAGGFLQAIRIRSIDGGVHGNIYMHHNIVKGTADNNPATTSIGKEVRTFFHSVQRGDQGNVIVENNRFTARALSPGTDSKAFIVESLPGVANPGNIYRFNYIEGNEILVRLGDANLPGNNIILENDTLAFLTPIYETPRTFLVGRYMGQSLNNSARDCIFLNGAADTNISLVHCQDGDSEFLLEKTIMINVRGYNNLPVAGAGVSITNNYGHTMAAPFTNYNGRSSQVLSYWYEAEYNVDSTQFNGFSIKVKKDNDSAMAYLNIGSTTNQVFLVLPNTAGENCDDCTYTCGDANEDGTVNILDIVFIIYYLYKGGPAPDPVVSADADGNGLINLMDVIYIRNYLYKAGAAPICE